VTNFASKKAIFIPKHRRGPAWNGKYWNGCIFFKNPVDKFKQKNNVGAKYFTFFKPSLRFEFRRISTPKRLHAMKLDNK